MNDDELMQRQEVAQVAQRNMMLAFKQTQEYQLIRNTFEVLRFLWSKDRLKAMKTQSMRETCLYYSGKEDAVQELLESIDKIIADGDAIIKKNEILAGQGVYE